MSYQNASNILAGFAAGIIGFAFALYMLGAKVNFVWDSSPFEAVIVEVSHEYVPAGRGSKLAYVPIVQLPATSGLTVPVKVGTHDENPVYLVGGGINVLCDLTVPRSCIRDSFGEIWLPVFAAFGISLGFILVAFVMKKRIKG